MPVRRANDENKALRATCWVTFLWSMSSLMVFALLPSFLTEELMVSRSKLGFIEGAAVCLAFVSKAFSGLLSDMFKTRRSLIIAGSIGSIMIKPLFACSTGIWSIFWARSLDRLSKGIRSGPVGAHIADISAKINYGTSYGMCYSFDTAGLLVGSVLASGLYALTASYRLVFYCAMIPGVFALVVVYRYVHDHAAMHQNGIWHWLEIRLLPKRYWQILGGIFILMQARFSELFLNLRAKEFGWPVAVIPLLFVGYYIVCAYTAWPIGKLTDRNNHSKVFLIGLAILMLANLIMIIAPNKWWVIVGFLLYGLHMGMTHGLLSTLVAKNTLPHLRGTAFAIYYLVTGVAILMGNSMAGFLAQTLAAGAFYGGLVFTALAAIYFYTLARHE